MKKLIILIFLIKTNSLYGNVNNPYFLKGLSDSVQTSIYNKCIANFSKMCQNNSLFKGSGGEAYSEICTKLIANSYCSCVKKETNNYFFFNNKVKEKDLWKMYKKCSDYLKYEI